MSEFNDSADDGKREAAVALEKELRPQANRPDIATIVNGDLSKRDMMSFISAAVDQDGLVGHNRHGYNDLIENGINRIMTQLFDIDRILRNERSQTQRDRDVKSFQVHIQFHDVKIARPTCTTYLTGQFTDLYPGRARLTGLPYSGPVTLGATISVKSHFEDGRFEEKTAEIPPFQIGTFPTLVGGSNCHTSNSTREGLKEMGEDPTDPGGYFIAKRGEYVVDLLENIRYNAVHIHRKMKANEHIRAEILSQPGGAFENSSQIKVRLMTNGQITVEINSVKFEKVRFPFYVIYRLFGMTDDRAITETIVFDTTDEGPITTHMLDYLERAFQLSDTTFATMISELNREKLVQMTAERVSKYLTNPKAYINNENAIQFLNEDLLGSPTKPGGLDKILLPHMGQTAESRIRKLRFLGLLIHKMFLVHLGVLPPTDRDSYRNKRVHGAGVSLAKAFKTQVNNSIVIPIFRAVKRELKNNPWESVTDKTLIDTFRNALTTSDLNRAMEQAITAGNKTIVVRRRAATNRVSSQALERKNGLNTFSALRTVVTQNAGNASKQTERADMMRRVHPTYVGFICIAQSADTGENVGMRKQLAITAGVCTAGEALPLKLRLLADPVVTALDDVTSVRMLRESLARVFVNGEWIGVCTAAHELVGRYRALRREGRVVDPHTTIYWDPVTDEVEFWLDVGRLRRPLLIVDSNIEAYDAALFKRHSWIKTYGGAPVEGIIAEDEAGSPAGVYFAGADRYFAFRAGSVAVPEGGMSLDAAIALTTTGGAVEGPTPGPVRETAAAFGERYGVAGAGDAPSRVDFVQNIRFTAEHARGIVEGSLSMNDLVKLGIVEYITPEEQENCLIAESVEVLFNHQNDVTMQFSHCDVEQAVFGLAAHVSPFGNHTQPARVTYETNQGRQTGGWYVLNFPFRTDKNRFFQFYNEIPLVRTFTHKLVPSNGLNTYIAYASYGGDNQEDSAIVCQASADRGLFAGDFFRFELAELEKGEAFCNPDALTTKNLKPNASYEKLVDGFIRVGSIVRYGDVLFGRTAKLSRGRTGADERYQFTDRSIVYRLDEPAVVEAVLRPRGANDELFGLVKLRYERPLRTGDKMSSRSGNKSIVALMLQQSDMPFTENGLTPDMIINTHCIAAETPITTYYGTSRRIDAMPLDGGEVLWGWDAKLEGFVQSHQLKRMTRGLDDVVRVTLSDGRTLRCTANHRVLTRDSDGVTAFVEAGSLTRDHNVVMGPEAPLDQPADDEVGWTFRDFHMGDEVNREQALAFARVLGLLCTDGCVTENMKGSGHIADVYLGPPVDVETILRDIRVLTGNTPAATRGDGVWVVRLPAELGRLVAVPGMSIGKKVHATPDWPHFIVDQACPKSVVREFLGGLYGGDGHAPYLYRSTAANRKAKNGLDRYCLLGVNFELTIVDSHSAAMREKMEALCGMLERVGVPGATVSGPTRRVNSQKALDGCPRLQFGVRIPPGTEFATHVGFRYCIQKAARLDAANAYWRYTENVRRQHEYVYERACAHFDNGFQIADALDAAREDLLDSEPAINDYYSLLTVNIVNNRRRSKGRKKTLDRLDYTRIDDVETFFRRAGCFGWFVQVDGGARTKTGYITTLDEMHLAPFTLSVADVRPGGQAMTYDLAVPIARTFIAGGFTVSNSFPTRMTIGQLIETSLGKICARKGVLADGTAFLPVDHLAIAAEMKDLGFRYNGRERMYNGMTGEYFDASIFIGPTAEQRLQKFVLDDEQAVAGSGPTDATTGQPLGGKHVQGGLRLGEMEDWGLEAHGSMLNLFEKTNTDSDGRQMNVCRGCGSLAAFNEYHSVYQCRTCGEMADIATVDGSKAAILLHEELAAANIRVRLGLRPREFERGGETLAV